MFVTALEYEEHRHEADLLAMGAFARLDTEYVYE